MSDQNSIEELEYEREEKECHQCGHFPSSCICGCKICKRNTPEPKPKETKRDEIKKDTQVNEDDSENSCSICGHKPSECDCGCNECASNK